MKAGPRAIVLVHRLPHHGWMSFCNPTASEPVSDVPPRFAFRQDGAGADRRRRLADDRVAHPDKKPFYGGTYFPARDGDRGARLGFTTRPSIRFRC